MKIHILFVALAGLAGVASPPIAAAQAPAWNDPAISDGQCSYPPPIAFPQQVFNILKGLPQGFKAYVPFGSSVYYTWMSQQVNAGMPPANHAQILSTVPRVVFPDLTAPLSLAAGRVDVYGHSPPRHWYKLQPIPVNLVATDLLVNIVAPSPGSAPYGFGGTFIPTRTIWADDTAYLEWHCFAGGVQAFNVISLHPTLTVEQETEISYLVESYGFKPENFVTISY